MITFELPVSQHIRKYLIATYGESYRLSINDDFGILIVSCLSREGYYDYKRSQDNRSTTYLIHMSMSSFEKLGCILENQQVYRIHKSLEYQFRSSMYRNAIINKHCFGIEYKKSIIAYLDSYGIEESEMSYSSIRKDFNRKKTQIKSQLRLEKLI